MNFTTYPPKERDIVVPFEDDKDKLAKFIEFKLVAKTTKKVKDKFQYKGGMSPVDCEVIGFIASYNIVIKFDDGSLSCIHPAWLKEMQKKSFTLIGGDEGAE